jgi:hypothetical protein
VNLACNGYPSGYASKPVLHGGQCEGPPDAGGGGGPCVTSGDCGAGYECAYRIADACAARGTCVAADTGPLCNLFVPGCACSGATVDIACNGYPTGYAPEPILHSGACEGIDAGAHGGTFPCGTLSCSSATEICKEGVGGPAGAKPTYACIAFPAQCGADRSCACVQQAEGAQLCSADASGDVTVTFEYP